VWLLVALALLGATIAFVVAGVWERWFTVE
jgi:hypothetical protein